MREKEADVGKEISKIKAEANHYKLRNQKDKNIRKTCIIVKSALVTCLIEKCERSR